ncbi:MAG: hypothetical protein HY658_03505 [Actinobacteria bacterium]|nr:hypothetical protein [Actinomycetota bacterium]
MRMRMLAAVLGAAMLLVACGGGGGELDVEMRKLNDSGQSGTATLTEEDGQTRVVLDLADSPAGPQPAHIHPGTCDELDPQPAYPLNNVENGSSDTTVNVSLEELRDGEFAINVHLSGEEVQTYVACGEIA